MDGSSTLKMTTRFSFLLLIAILFILTLTSAQNVTSTSIRGKAEGSILKMYYDVSALPIKDAKASFRNASSNDKSELWRTHLALFLVKRPELNETQKEIILAAMSLATAEFFEVRSSDPAWKAKVRDPLRSLEEQITKGFSRKDAAKIFAMLGDGTESANCSSTYPGSVLLKKINYVPLSNPGSLVQRADIRVGEQDKGAGLERSPCECSTDSDWCPISKYCSGTNCSPTQSGCGTLWSYPCNGASCK
jgi:hypothetical protein